MDAGRRAAGRNRGAGPKVALGCIASALALAGPVLFAGSAGRPPPSADVPSSSGAGPAVDEPASCPPGMVLVERRYCIDAFEASTVEMRDDGSVAEHSPYLPVTGLNVRAVSRAGVVPQAYINQIESDAACRTAGKRLCTDEEWVTACRGPDKTLYPYGNERRPGYCVDTSRTAPLPRLFPDAGAAAYRYVPMNDPRLNRLAGTLAPTGTFPRCTNAFRVYDMVGNVHEWTSNPSGAFRGGYYLDTQINGEGCLYRTVAHARTYHDYSTGFRCCADPARPRGDKPDAAVAPSGLVRMKPRAVLRRSPEDFVVEEIPAYAPSGAGEHLFVRVRKRDVTTFEAVRRIGRALGAPSFGSGFAGMKDRRAVAVQTLSFPFPVARAAPSPVDLASEGIDVLSVDRNSAKLKPGHLKGNRFTITLRDVLPADIEAVAASLERAAREGVPNAFGGQRFGRDGDNAERAIACLTRRSTAPRDRRELRLLFSALQSALFNAALDERVSEGTWNTALEGDLLKKHATGGMFLCADPGADSERAARLEVSPTGPIFGSEMRWPEGRPAEIERRALERAGGMGVFERNRLLGRGSRRSLRLIADAFCVERVEDDPAALRVGFVLPKGGYATTLLACAVRMDEEETLDEETVGE